MPVLRGARGTLMRAPVEDVISRSCLVIEALVPHHVEFGLSSQVVALHSTVNAALEHGPE